MPKKSRGDSYSLGFPRHTNRTLWLRNMFPGSSVDYRLDSIAFLGSLGVFLKFRIEGGTTKLHG